jgi:HSP20 family protein
MAKYRNERNNPPRSGRGTRSSSGGMETRGRESEASREPSLHRKVGTMEVQHRPGAGQESLAHQALASPFSFMRRFSEEMDRLFEDFGFGRGWLSPSMGELSPSGFRELGRAAWTPQVEVFRRGDELVIRCDLPGMRKEDVRVDIQEDQLVLQGERSWQDDQDREGVVRSERHYGSFYRAIPLPDGVRAEQARATYKDGVLEISLPAPEERQRGHRVSID